MDIPVLCVVHVFGGQHCEVVSNEQTVFERNGLRTRVEVHGVPFGEPEFNLLVLIEVAGPLVHNLVETAVDRNEVLRSREHGEVVFFTEVLRIVVNNETVGNVAGFLEHVVVPLAIEHAENSDLNRRVNLLHGFDELTGALTINGTAVLTILFIVRVPVTIDFVTDFPVNDAGLLVDVGVLHPCGSFLFGAGTEVHGEHGVRTGLLQPGEEFVGIDHPVVVVEDFLPVVVIGTETTRITDDAVVDALGVFSSLNLELRIVEHVAIPKCSIDTEEAARDVRVDDIAGTLDFNLHESRTFSSLDFLLVGELDVIDFEATVRTFSTRFEVKRNNALEIELAVFLGGRRLVVRELGECAERHDHRGTAARNTGVGNEEFVTGVTHLNRDGLPCAFRVDVKHDAPMVGPVTTLGIVVSTVLGEVEHDVNPVGHFEVLHVEGVAIELGGLERHFHFDLGLRTLGRFPVVLGELAFEVGNHDIRSLGLPVVPLDIRVNPVDGFGEGNLVHKDGHRSRLARFACVFTLAHRETDFLNLVPLHVLGNFGLLVSVPSLTLVVELLQRNLHELPVGADLGAFDPVVQADLGLALDVVALVVEDTDVNLFAAELTLDPEVETALVADLGEVNVLAFAKRVRHTGPVVVIDVESKHVLVASRLGVSFALSGKTTVAVAEALQAVGVEHAISNRLDLAVELFGVLRSVDHIGIFIPVNNLRLRLGLLVALHDFDIVHPDFEILRTALVDGETDFSNLIPIDTGREFGLAGVVPVETAIREIDKRNRNLLPFRRHGAAFDILVHRENNLGLFAVRNFFVQQTDLDGFAALLALDHEFKLGVQQELAQVESFVVKANRGTGVFTRVELDVKGSLGLVAAVLSDGDTLALAAVSVVEATLTILVVKELVRNYARSFRLSHCSRHAEAQEGDGSGSQCTLHHISYPFGCV